MANVIGIFAVGKKSSVGRDPETVELQLRAAMNPLTRGRIRTTNTP